MTYELKEFEILQKEGNSIIHFKPTQERELVKEIEEENRELANIYLYLESSDLIVGFHENRGRENFSYRRKIETSKDSLKFRKFNASLIRKSKQEIIQNALRIVCDKLNAQTAAIFLISKNGLLERAGIYGLDKDGKQINDNWFSEEKYEIGESFTGKAAQPREGSRYGEIQYAKDLIDRELKLHSKEKYLEKFGFLKCGIAIPLNGRNKTYGVLRVFNKIDKTAPQPKNTLTEALFSKDDVRLMLFLTTSIANALSNFRRDIQVEVLKYLSRLLIQPTPGTYGSLENVYQQVMDLIVQNPETAFKAGILRSKNNESKTLDVKAVSISDEIVGNRDNSPRKINDEGFLWLIVDNRKRLILQDIQEDKQISQFKNKKWIKDNNFQSFGCFPLVAKDETVGTLSLYTGYNYEFYPDSINFLQGVADLIASFMLKVKQEEQEQELKKNLNSSSTEDSGYVEAIESRFSTLAKEWKQATAATSSLTEKTMHPAYQQIIGLGPNVIPLLLRELAERPDHWFWALRAISGEDPVEPEQHGRIKKMAEAWLEWGRKQGYEFTRR